MSKTKNLEELLLKDTIVESVEATIEEEIVEAKKPKIQGIITNIKEVPHKSILWGRKTVFYVFNRDEGTEQEVLGSQARSLLGSNLSAIKAMERGEKTQVMTDKYVIKFLEYKV